MLFISKLANRISTKKLAQFPKNWSHGNMHGLNEISEKLKWPTLEFNSNSFKLVKWVLPIWYITKLPAI